MDFMKNKNREKKVIKKIGILEGLLLSIMLVAVLQALLIIVKSETYSHYISIGWIAILLIIPFLRRIFPSIMLTLAIFSTSVFFYDNFYELKSRKLEMKQSLVSIFDIAFTNGSNGVFKKIIIRTRHRKYLAAINPEDPKINVLASKLVKDCASGNHYCETSKLLSFVSNKIKYRSDPISSSDYVKPPALTLEARAGDCEDQSILLISLLGSLGIRSYLVFTNNHAYPLVCFKKRLKSKSRYMRIKKEYCYHLEPTVKNSKIGFYHKSREITYVFDPLTRREVYVNPNNRIFK